MKMIVKCGQIGRDSLIGAVIGGILNWMCRRKMCVDPPQPIRKENENDDCHDLIDSALFRRVDHERPFFITVKEDFSG